LNEVLVDGFLSSLVFFSFDQSQLLLLEPVGVDFTSDWDFLLDRQW